MRSLDRSGDADDSRKNERNDGSWKLHLEVTVCGLVNESEFRVDGKEVGTRWMSVSVRTKELSTSWGCVIYFWDSKVFKSRVHQSRVGLRRKGVGPLPHSSSLNKIDENEKILRWIDTWICRSLFCSRSSKKEQKPRNFLLGVWDMREQRTTNMELKGRRAPVNYSKIILSREFERHFIRLRTQWKRKLWVLQKGQRNREFFCRALPKSSPSVIWLEGLGKQCCSLWMSYQNLLFCPAEVQNQLIKLMQGCSEVLLLN